MMPECSELLVLVVKREHYLRYKWKDWPWSAEFIHRTGRKAEYITADAAR